MHLMKTVQRMYEARVVGPRNFICTIIQRSGPTDSRSFPHKNISSFVLRVIAALVHNVMLRPYIWCRIDPSLLMPQVAYHLVTTSSDKQQLWLWVK